MTRTRPGGTEELSAIPEPHPTARLTDLVADRLHVAGGMLRLGPDVSWSPPDEWGRYQPLNCYAVREDDGVLIIDPGPACFQELVTRQLRTIVRAGSPVSVYITRPEFDTFSGLNSIAEVFDIQQLYSGGHANPFDGLDLITTVAPTHASEHLLLERLRAGTAIPVGRGRAVTILRPTMRVLNTYWLHDSATATLFTSDAFGHLVADSAAEGRVAGPQDDGCDVETVARHMFAKFWWMPYAGPEIERVADELRAIFDRNEVRRIAPARGKVIAGADRVRRHYELVLEVFAGISSGRWSATVGGRDPEGAQR
ncbi:MAG: hypothetical protein AB7J32_08780 [Pseudonocardia sp.]